MNKFNTLILMILLMGAGSGSIVCMDIFEASEKGSIERVREFIAAGANLDAKTQYGKTPLHGAAFYGHKEIVQVLIGAGANMEAKDQDGLTPLYKVANNGKHEVAEVLITAGANLEAKTLYGKTPLHGAAFYGHQEVVKVLVAAGANIGAKDWFDRTPLHEATYNGNQNVMQVLIAAGANIKIKDKDGKTPLCIANERGHRAIVAGITGYQRQVPVIAGMLAQSLHRRLGAESPVGLLPQHLIKNISRLSAAALCFERNVAQAEEYDARRQKTASYSRGCVVS